MEDDDRPVEATPVTSDTALVAKLDTVAGAVAAIAASHTDLLSHAAEAEARRREDVQALADRLDAIERRAAEAPPTIPPPPGAPEPLRPLVATDLDAVRADLALSLDVLARVAEAIERLDSRTEDRLAAVRDAAVAPVADLQALLAARNERHDAQLDELATTVQTLAAEGPAPIRERLADLTDAVAEISARPLPESHAVLVERIEELSTAVQAVTWQLPEIVQEVAALRAGLADPPLVDEPELVNDDGASLTDATEQLGDRLALHVDTALAGTLRVIDERLVALRTGIADVVAAATPPPAAGMGFEAGAVMGAAQAAWNRLEQRLDSEFDDLGRQLQAMITLIEQAVATSEAVANRPVVTGDQLRRAASAVKESVVGASRARRDRRGGPRGLGSGR